MSAIDEHSGLFTTMIGIIVIVMSAVGLTVLVDKRTTSNKSSKTNDADIEDARLRIESLMFRKNELDERYALKSSRREPIALQMATVEQAIKQLKDSRESMTAEKASLEKNLVSLESDFTNYRARYVAAERSSAVGEVLGTFRTKRGTVYEQATISKITDAGMEIRHEHGIARLQPYELDPVYQDRFQWSGEAHHAALRLERQQAAEHYRLSIAKSDQPKRGVAKSGTNPPAKDQSALWADLEMKRARVSSLVAELNTASGGSLRNPNRSFGTTLETLETRNSRLQRQLARARAEVAIAEARLGITSTNRLHR